MIDLKVYEDVLRILSQKQKMKLSNDKFTKTIEITNIGRHI